MTHMASAATAGQTGQIRRLHWGCGRDSRTGWINSDLRALPGVDICADVLTGLPLEDNSIDYVSSQHVLPELEIWDQKTALRELRRVLKPKGVLRLGLPDFDRAIAIYQRGRQRDLLLWPWETFSGNFITQILWHSTTKTLFTYEFTEELLLKSGFQEVRRSSYRVTSSPYGEIVVLDNREHESFYVEAFK